MPFPSQPSCHVNPTATSRSSPSFLSTPGLHHASHQAATLPRSHQSTCPPSQQHESRGQKCSSSGCPHPHVLPFHRSWPPDGGQLHQTLTHVPPPEGEIRSRGYFGRRNAQSTWPAHLGLKCAEPGPHRGIGATTRSCQGSGHNGGIPAHQSRRLCGIALRGLHVHQHELHRRGPLWRLPEVELPVEPVQAMQGSERHSTQACKSLRRMEASKGAHPLAFQLSSSLYLESMAVHIPFRDA